MTNSARGKYKAYTVRRKNRQLKQNSDGWTDAVGIAYKFEYQANDEAERLAKLMCAAYRVYYLDTPLRQYAPAGNEIIRTEIRLEGKTNEGSSTSSVRSAQDERAAVR